MTELLLQIKALDCEDDFRALDSDGKPIKPETVQTYLQRAFKTRLPDAERALKVSAAMTESYGTSSQCIAGIMLTAG